MHRSKGWDATLRGATSTGEPETRRLLNGHDEAISERLDPLIVQAPTPPTQPVSLESTPAEAPNSTGRDDATAQDPRTSRSFPPATEPQFRLAPEQMRENLVTNLAKFAKDPAFMGLVRIEVGGVNWKDLMKGIKVLGRHDFLAIEYFADTGVEGVARLRLPDVAIDPSDLQQPDMLQPVEKPSDAEIGAFLDSAADAPPNGPIFYYVGEPLVPDFDPMLHAGEDLGRLPPVPGVNTAYWHYGGSSSGNAFRFEDAEMYSCSDVIGPGLKFWLIIWKSQDQV